MTSLANRDDHADNRLLRRICRLMPILTVLLLANLAVVLYLTLRNTAWWMGALFGGDLVTTLIILVLIRATRRQAKAVMVGLRNVLQLAEWFAMDPRNDAKPGVVELRARILAFLQQHYDDFYVRLPSVWQDSAGEDVQEFFDLLIEYDAKTGEDYGKLGLMFMELIFNNPNIMPMLDGFYHDAGRQMNAGLKLTDLRELSYGDAHMTVRDLHSLGES